MKHLSLLELNNTIKQVLDKQLESSYWVLAEISEIRLNPKGHCYLELVEKEGTSISAKAKGTIWSYTYRNLSTWFEGMTGQSLKAGLKILFNASVQYHEVYGLSLNIKDIDAGFTIGEKALQRQKVLKQLSEDGVLEMNKELPLPLVPQRIAVISSSTAAGYGDFMDQIEHNEYGYHFHAKLFSAVMQGNTAPASIIDALIKINEDSQDFDLVVLIRGGGSQLDLDCFDDYNLNAHLAQFPLPILTGIGHERDEAIADIVAHTSFKTPTAVAEFLIQGIIFYDQKLMEGVNKIVEFAQSTIANEQMQLYTSTLKLSQHTAALISQQRQAISITNERLKHAVHFNIDHQGQHLGQLQQAVRLLSPENILQRGYSITLLNNKVIDIKTKIKKGDNMTTETAFNKIQSEVTSTTKKK